MKKRHPIADLPFVKDTPKGRNFWGVKPPHDPWEASRLGSQYALEWLRFEAAPKRRGEHHSLISIVHDMPRKLGHMEMSFLSLVGFAARAGLPEAERLEAYWCRCASKDAAKAA
jgi:hypothetical protein